MAHRLVLAPFDMRVHVWSFNRNVSRKTGHTWEPLSGLYVLERYDSHGFGWNVVALRLDDGGLLLYSPSWLGAETFARIDALGPVRAMLVPSAYHHVALPRFRARYPNALVCASQGAQPRLVRKGHAPLASLDSLTPLLPEGAYLHAPEAFKSGETWLSLKRDGVRTWLVCDAFMNLDRELTGFSGFVAKRLIGLRRGQLCIPRTMRWLHLRDPKAYRRFVEELIFLERPTCLVPTHGAPLTALDLPERLRMSLEHDL